MSRVEVKLRSSEAINFSKSPPTLYQSTWQDDDWDDSEWQMRILFTRLVGASLILPPQLLFPFLTLLLLFRIHRIPSSEHTRHTTLPTQCEIYNVIKHKSEPSLHEREACFEEIICAHFCVVNFDAKFKYGIKFILIFVYGDNILYYRGQLQ